MNNLNSNNGQINRYQAYVLVGGSAANNYWIGANSPEQLNRMVTERLRYVQYNEMFHVVVFPGDMRISTSQVKAATAIAFENKDKFIMSFVKPSWDNRFLVNMGNASLGKTNLIFNKVTA
jgi:hypothetical protein